MNEQQYYEEIEYLIKKNEISKRVRKLEDTHDTVITYWNVGRLIVEAQGGSKRAKYGNELIKNWSIKLTELYGKGYDATNLKRFRQFYLTFEKGAPLEHQITWTNYKELLPIKNENKRNFYINKVNYFQILDNKILDNIAYLVFLVHILFKFTLLI